MVTEISEEVNERRIYCLNNATMLGRFLFHNFVSSIKYGKKKMKPTGNYIKSIVQFIFGIPIIKDIEEIYVKFNSFFKLTVMANNIEEKFNGMT